jgi:hypothetical protein
MQRENTEAGTSKNLPPNKSHHREPRMFHTTTFVTPTGDFHLTTVMHTQDKQAKEQIKDKEQTKQTKETKAIAYQDGHWYVTDPTPLQQMATAHGLALTTVTAIYITVES